jgi:hypothetical protein
VNRIPRPFRARSGGDEKGRERATMDMSPHESKTGPELVLTSPCVNMAGDVFLWE